MLSTFTFVEKPDGPTVTAVVTTSEAPTGISAQTFQDIYFAICAHTSVQSVPSFPNTPV